MIKRTIFDMNLGFLIISFIELGKGTVKDQNNKRERHLKMNFQMALSKIYTGQTPS
jgi:hypothetical protein